MTDNGRPIRDVPDSARTAAKGHAHGLRLAAACLAAIAAGASASVSSEAATPTPSPSGATAPTVSGVSPDVGATAGGTAVTITGSGFSGASRVQFGSVAAAGFTVASAMSITATSAPAAAGTVDVTVTTGGGTSVTSPADDFTFVAPEVWTGATELGGAPMGGSPHAISWGYGNLDVFWRGTDNGLWHMWYSNGWHGPQFLGGAGTMASDPYPVSWGPGHIDVFWKGTDGNLWHAWYLGGWYGPQSLGDGPLGSAPHPVSWGVGHIDVFWEGADGGLWHAWYLGGWYGPQALGGVGTMASDPAPVSWGVGHIDVFWKGTDGGLWHAWYLGGWSGPQSLGDGPLAGAPQPVSAGYGHINVFWRGTDSALVEAVYSSDGWSGPIGLGGSVSGDPAPTSPLLGNIEVVYVGADGLLWHDDYVDGWSGPADLGDGPATQPSAVSWGSGHSEVFWEGTDAGLWHDWYQIGISSRTIPVPAISMGYPLDCEAAALEAALAAQGTSVSQSWLLGQFGADLRSAVVVRGNVIRWGDAWATFVGNVYGSEPAFTGYGVYWPPLERVATSLGHYASGGQDWTAQDGDMQLSEGHPGIIWIDASFQAVGVRWWTAWDGAAVPYAVGEHAVVLSGIDVQAGTVRLLNVANGSFDTFTMARFDSFWTTFSDMALVID